jgi:arabinogalactan oligomer/maltooligosaccharide transport system permease protein
MAGIDPSHPMAAGAAPAAAPPPDAFRPGTVARAIAAFSGGPGLVVKIVLLSLMNALAAWAAYVLIDRSRWIPLAVLVVATLAIDLVYVAPRGTLPAKFLVPGVVFLVAFQITPILYTINVAFTNYSTGHIASRPEAISAIQVNSLEPPANGRQYSMAPARTADGTLVLILRDDASGSAFAGSRNGLEPLAKADVTAGAAGITAAKGYTLVKGADLFALDAQLRTFTVPTSGSSAIRPQGIDSAVELRPTLRYDTSQDAFIRISDGTVFKDNGKGSFATAAGKELEPGWKTAVGFQNFGTILHDPLIRGPFLRVFVWTFAFAILSVLLSFSLGLFLAIALDKSGMRFQRGYRSLLILPYAIPSFLSLLIWAGLLNDDFGVVNRLFHTNIPWLFDANWAKVSVILVDLWLTFPYFFLVSMGALQSIPGELTEAAHVDGGGAWQIFRRVTLPLLLVATAPLLIASFAFAFNNFGAIYLLTGGGPATGGSSIAGATDILITYTYKLALASGKGQDFGLASAISIIIFLIVASISGVTFWRTKALETAR